MLLIYYLYSQLGFSLPAIINKAGGTLEKTYHALTGKNGGYKAFAKLLAKFSRSGIDRYCHLVIRFPCLTARHAMCTPLPQNRRTPRPEGSISGTGNLQRLWQRSNVKLRVDAHQPERTAHLRRACNRIRSAGLQLED